MSWSKTISVPYTNKELDVTLETFRKEMAPDDAEEWTVSIKDNSGKPAKAEFLTTMYDASLDVLTANNWSLSPHRFLNPRFNWNTNSFGRAQSQVWNRNWMKYPSSAVGRNFEEINWFGYYIGQGRYGNVVLESVATRGGSRSRGMAMSDMAVPMEESQAMVADGATDEVQLMMKNGGGDSKAQPPKDIKMRSDFSETVFFKPHLVSDENGNISFKFNAPQSLTRWKFMGLATTEVLKIGTITEEVVTRKQLMITPNYPRFVREGDKLVFQVKVNVLDSSVFDAKASIELMDALQERRWN